MQVQYVDLPQVTEEQDDRENCARRIQGLMVVINRPNLHRQDKTTNYYNCVT